MELRTLLRGAALALTAGIAAAGRPAGNEAEALRVVMTGAQAYVLAPTEPVARGQIEGVWPAPTGRYVLIAQRALDRTPLPGENPNSVPGKRALLLFDSRTRRTTSLWRAPDGPGEPSVMVHGFFAGTAVALVDAVRIVDNGKGTLVHALSRINCVTATLTPVGGEGEGIARVDFSPSKPLAAIGDRGLFTIAADGARRAVALPAGAIPAGWLGDGETLHAFAASRDPQTKTITRRHWLVASRTGEAREVEKVEPAPPPPAPPKPSIALRQLDASVGETPVTALYLQRAEAPVKKGESPAPYGRTLVAAESDPRTAILLPDLSAALWQNDGTLYARPLVALEQTAFENLLRELKRKAVMSEAKQVGLALMMYAQDYDENFPPSGGGLAMVDPYLKSADMLGRFNFTYNGPSNLGKIDSPATTQLGFVAGPGGRAIVYADGHVRWFDN